MNLRWVGEEDFDRVAETRLRCYAHSPKEIDKFKSDLRGDTRAQPGDFLLLEQDGQPIGTTTAMSLHMWVRGGRIPCQGVAYVGTIRTARRGGIANQLMQATIEKAREREQVATALMPFRASFYERFGYGFAEQRTDWIVPLSLMPAIDTGGIRYATDADRSGIAALRQRFVERGQCDIETSKAGWALRRANEENGFQIVDGEGDHVRAWAMLASDMSAPSRPVLRIQQAAWNLTGDLLRLLSFLGGQRDQYATGSITLPTDLPLNRVLRETQLPHRPVSHAFTESKSYTRMQIRVLDHRRFLEALRLPAWASGSFTVGIQEREGQISRWRVEISEGRIGAKPHNGDCDVMCADRVWASIVSGDLRARTAVAMGLAQCTDERTIKLLDAFADGPAPFCNEYF